MLVLTVLVAPAKAHRVPLKVERSSAIASPSLCDNWAGPLAYHWPLKPFDRQHAIRGNFGDPRTISRNGPLGEDGPGSGGDYSFHNGIDIEARAGAPVYPVASGIVERWQPNAVVVRTRDDRKFLYWHIHPVVGLGAEVTAGKTVLGLVQSEFKHLHFAEVDRYRLHNPLDRGHLTPYQDRTAPLISTVQFDSRDDERQLDPGQLQGVVWLEAQAEDPPPLPIYGVWDDRPVTPAVLAWRLQDESGATVVPEHTVVDFRHSEPPKRMFWNVYAEGTYQNFPDFGHHYFWGVSGRYLFNLTPGGLDTRRLADGRYLLTVEARDECGNRGSLTQEVETRN